LKNPDIEIIPLGGLNKIGSNICCFKTKNHTIAIDAGIRFPDTEHFDLNFTLPNLSVIESLDYIIITHGHEDHIGGIAKVIEKFPSATIITTRFNDHLVREKLNKYQTGGKIITIPSETPYEIGKNLQFEFIHVNHSIPFTKGVHIETRDSSVLFISDFKIEDHGLYEKPLDLKKLESLGAHKKWRIAMLDSTSILSKKRPYDEKDVYNNLEHLIATVNKKIFITTFASNVYRVCSVFNICNKYGKKVFVKSPAMSRFIEIAVKYEILNEDILKKTLLKSDRNIPSNTVILLSGSQGEKRSSLKNLLVNKKPFVKIVPGDAFCFSSKIIPGNERGVFNIYDEIVKKGGIIFNDRDGFHTSGHADQADLFKIYQHYNPNTAIPIHGSIYFLNSHQEFIKRNFPKVETINIFNFDKVLVGLNEIKVEKETAPNIDHYMFYFGKQSLNIPIENLNERKKMAEKGLVSIVAKKNKKGFLHIESLQTLGLPCEPENNKEILNVLNQTDFDSSNLEQSIREVLNKYFEHHLGCRPKSILHIL
jgi:ribonuclease J